MFISLIFRGVTEPRAAPSLPRTFHYPFLFLSVRFPLSPFLPSSPIPPFLPLNSLDLLAPTLVRIFVSHFSFTTFPLPPSRPPCLPSLAFLHL